MTATSHPSKISAIIWLTLIFGSIIAIGVFAWSAITNQPEPTKTSTSEEEVNDPNTFNIDDKLDMLN